MPHASTESRNLIQWSAERTPIQPKTSLYAETKKNVDKKNSSRVASKSQKKKAGIKNPTGCYIEVRLENRPRGAVHLLEKNRGKVKDRFGRGGRNRNDFLNLPVRRSTQGRTQKFERKEMGPLTSDSLASFSGWRLCDGPRYYRDCVVGAGKLRGREQVSGQRTGAIYAQRVQNQV